MMVDLTTTAATTNNTTQSSVVTHQKLNQLDNFSENHGKTIKNNYNIKNNSTKLKNFVGKTPGLLRSKLMNVLGSSNEIITDLSNKLDVVLTLSTSSSSESGESQGINKETDSNSKGTLENYDDELFDFEIRRIKERRAHEEVLSGKYRHPNYNMSSHDIISLDDFEDLSSIRTTSISEGLSGSSPSDIPFCSTSQSHHGHSDRDLSSQSYLKPPKFLPPSASGSGSEIISLTNPSGSMIGERVAATTDDDCKDNTKSCNRSESFVSVRSTMSSLSLDSQFEELSSSCYEFMKSFVDILFENSEKLSPEVKSEFGKWAMTETGRMWFSRLINVQRVKTKKVNELTFYALVQYFAIVLFECSEADDFTPAKNLMNMCFTFYHEVDVPGCEPYREYLYNYLREQPIWLSLRFWNAAFFDALQCERANRPIPKLSGLNSRTSIGSLNNDLSKSVSTPTNSTKSHASKSPSINSSLSSPQSSSASHSNSSSISSLSNNDIDNEAISNEIREDQKFQQNITFGQLGTFTCNMHAFGLSQELCVDFLRKQCTIANLNGEQEKMLRDNISRMYKETDKWRE